MGEADAPRLADGCGTDAVRTRVQTLLAAGFAFVGGWADSICMLRYNAFATMMTGNFFQLGFTLVHPRVNYPVPQFVALPKGRLPDPVFFLMVIFCYFLGVVLYRLREARAPLETGSLFGPLLALLLSLIEVIDSLCLQGQDIMDSRWVCCLLAPIFAVQNVMTMSGGLSVPTAFLSGHLQNLGVGVVAAALGALTRERCNEHIVSFTVIAHVVGGAAAGHAWATRFGYAGALMPIAPVMVVLFVVHDRVFRPQRQRELRMRLQPPARVRLELGTRGVAAGGDEAAGM